MWSINLGVCAALTVLTLGAEAVFSQPVARQHRDGDSPSAVPDAAASSTIERGRRFTEYFYTGRIAPIWQAMTSELRGSLGSRDALGVFRARIEREAGDERAVLEESREEHRGLEVYRRIARFTGTQAPIAVTWSFNDAGDVAGFVVEARPQPVASPYLDYETKAELRLPFHGAWHVFWGGRTLEQNYHVATPDQRFAYDFVVMRDGITHRGAGTRNEDYFCWEQPIIAPAGGRVIEAVDGRRDQTPGASDRATPAGNHVIVDLGNDEYAVLAHLLRGSVAVSRGEYLEPGELVGRCGNSGNTTEPHLHFHLQNSPDLGEGHGLPAFFNDYGAGGRMVERGEPLQGQTVGNADSSKGIRLPRPSQL